MSQYRDLRCNLRRRECSGDNCTRHVCKHRHRSDTTGLRIKPFALRLTLIGYLRGIVSLVRLWEIPDAESFRSGIEGWFDVWVRLSLPYTKVSKQDWMMGIILDESWRLRLMCLITTWPSMNVSAAWLSWQMKMRVEYCSGAFLVEGASSCQIPSGSECSIIFGGPNLPFPGL